MFVGVSALMDLAKLIMWETLITMPTASARFLATFGIFVRFTWILILATLLLKVCVRAVGNSLVSDSGGAAYRHVLAVQDHL